MLCDDLRGLVALVKREPQQPQHLWFDNLIVSVHRAEQALLRILTTVAPVASTVLLTTVAPVASTVLLTMTTVAPIASTVLWTTVAPVASTGLWTTVAPVTSTGLLTTVAAVASTVLWTTVACMQQTKLPDSMRKRHRQPRPSSPLRHAPASKLERAWRIFVCAESCVGRAGAG